MPVGRETEEFQQFFQKLIRPKESSAPPAPAQPTAVTHVTVNGPLRCKIYIGMPYPAPKAEAPARPTGRTKKP